VTDHALPSTAGGQPLRFANIWAKAEAVAATAVAQLDWAEDEIRLAQHRHQAAADHLYHAIVVLAPTSRLMTTEFVYRSHCRELLNRIAEGDDTREATAAEVAAACSEVSLVLPLGTAGNTLYRRTWTQAFPDQPVFDAAETAHYAYVAGDRTEQLETKVRQQLRQPTRTLDGVTCPGRHFTEPRPDCPYAAAAASDDGPHTTDKERHDPATDRCT
jgi:hypothetical protein